MNWSITLPKTILVAATFLVTQSNAWAAHAQGDYFSTNSTIKPSPSNQQSAEDAAKTWFKQYDQLVSQYDISIEDQIVLSQPIKSEAQRLAKFTQTAFKVASNRHKLAQKIRCLTIPQQVAQLKSYRDLTADWYDDSADVYEELVKPRKPATTAEELQDQINDVLKTSNTLKNNRDQLIALDKTIRLKYSVEAPDDALTKYVTTPNQ